MHHSSIKFGKNKVTKTAAPHLMRIEIMKTRRAFDIGRDCGLFRIPEVLEYDEANGTAVFERIHHIQPVRNVMNQSSRCILLMEQIGRSLAIIHRSLSLPDNMAIALPLEFFFPGTEVFLHGDFNGSNVCIEMSSQSIVILDWQMTGCYGGQATYGSRYFDLLWFINYMLWTPTLDYVVCDPVTPAAKTFFDSYFKESSIRFNANMLMHYAQRVFNIYIRRNQLNRNRRYRYLSWRSQILTKRFIESIKTMEPEANIVH